jgi:hypothetical protein
MQHLSCLAFMLWRHLSISQTKGCAGPSVAMQCQWGLVSSLRHMTSPAHHHPHAGPALGTCVGAREWAEEPRMLAVTIVHLHYVVEGRMEEGKLSKHHCGGDMMWRAQSHWQREDAWGWWLWAASVHRQVAAHCHWPSLGWAACKMWAPCHWRNPSTKCMFTY